MAGKPSRASPAGQDPRSFGSRRPARSVARQRPTRAVAFDAPGAYGFATTPEEVVPKDDEQGAAPSQPPQPHPRSDRVQTPNHLRKPAWCESLPVASRLIQSLPGDGPHVAPDV